MCKARAHLLDLELSEFGVASKLAYDLGVEVIMIDRLATITWSRLYNRMAPEVRHFFEPTYSHNQLLHYLTMMKVMCIIWNLFSSI